MSRIPIQDKFTNKGNEQQRYQWRRVEAGKCDRCGREHGDTRTSWLSGKPVQVKRRTCNICVERAVMAKLYPTKDEV